MRFFDTYAILAVLDGVPSYRKYTGTKGHTFMLNILEAAVQLLRRGMPNPLPAVRALGLSEVDLVDEDLMAAAAVKVEPSLRSRNLSYADAIGFVLARRLGVPFLTGDKGFRGLDGVEWVGF